MPVDASVPRTPGWWLQREFNRLADPYRRRRLDLLHDYRTGNAPLPIGAENAREAFTAFQSKARSNFAELVVSAVSERMTPVGFRTALDFDETGDAEVGELWERAGLDVECSNVHDMMLSMSEAYVIVGQMDTESGAPLVTGEDPRWMIGDPDPAKPTRLQCALKVLHDDVDKEDRAYLFLPADPRANRATAELWVARRRNSAQDLDRPGALRAGPTVSAFTARYWDWDTDRSGALPHTRIPVVLFRNKDGMGEYEAHTDIVDRINHQILQRMVIATMQAFRQRAVSGLPLTDPESGKVIDYQEVFTADPAALWQLPETAKMWESQQVDLRPILDAVKDDVTHLAAVTRTPMATLMPDAANQSAEGASFAREGLVFKTRDRITRTSGAWAQVMSLALLAANQADRADLAKLKTIWARPEHLSLAERADAAAKAAVDMPRRTRLIQIWDMSPAEADRVMTEWADERLQQQLEQQAFAAANPPPAANAQPQQAGAPAPGGPPHNPKPQPTPVPAPA